MAQRPFRFLHAADLHLDQPVAGLSEAPEHLVDLLIDCPARAAVRVFDAAIDERVDFVLLAGGVIDPRSCAPREWLLLVEQFERLADRNITVYWAGGPDDLVDSWPKHLAWPANVRIFPRGKVQRIRHEIFGEPVCEIIGRSHDADGPGQPPEYAPSRANLFTLAVAHAVWPGDVLAPIGVDYWALGCRHDRTTPLDSPHCVAHYPGAPQGRRPDETGLHGCTLGSADDQGRIRLTPISCDVVRWHAPRLALSESADCQELEQLLRQRTAQLLEEAGGVAALITWNISCEDALLAALRRGQWNVELVSLLRSEFGHRSPPAWTIDIVPELPDQLPTHWYSEESLRGDYLRAALALANDPSATAAVTATATTIAASTDPSSEPPMLISPGDLPPDVAEKLGWSAVSLDRADVRRRVLREAAWLGADLLSPYEPGPQETDR